VIQTASHQEGFYHHPDVSPDDRFTAFSVGANGFDFNTIWIHETETGQLTQLTMPDSTAVLGDVQVRWSPKGDLLGFASDRGGESHIYTIPAAGGTSRRITSRPLPLGTWNCRFSFSPDGRRIVYSDGEEGETNLFTIDLIDGRVEQITNFVGRNVYSPDWSADGTAIVYQSDSEFYIWDVTQRTERLLETDLSGNFPTWSPDGQWIGYQRSEDGWKTLLLPRSGGKAIRVGLGVEHESQVPSWSRDGRHLVYHGGKRAKAPLIVHELSDHSERVLVDTLSRVGWYWGSWSPDSRMLTFMNDEISLGSRETNLLLGSIETGTVTRIAQVYPRADAWLKQAPVWFADSERFLMIQGDSTDSQIAMASVAGPAPRPQTASNTIKSEMALSPDEELIAFVAESGDAMDIWLFDLVTEEEIQLTFTEHDKGSMVFSPNGEQIAFIQRNPDTAFDIMTIPVDGGQPRQRTTHSGGELDPSWVDDEQIAYTLHPTGAPRSLAVGSLEDERARSIITGGIASGRPQGSHLVFPNWPSDRSHVFYQIGWPDGPLMKRHMKSETVEELRQDVRQPILSRDGRRIAYIDASDAPLQYLWRENVEHIVGSSQLP
jgi:TolB protein